MRTYAYVTEIFNSFGRADITAIFPGSLLDNFNRANKGNEVQPGDHIVEVNGVLLVILLKNTFIKLLNNQNNVN